MLTRLDLRLFKCFELLKLPLAPLTLLSGPNSSGKSSVLQALVLLHQTMREHEWSTRLAINGAGVHLGAVVDVVDEVHGRTGFEIGVASEAAACHWTFEGDRREMSLRVRRVVFDGVASDEPESLRHLLPPRDDGQVEPLAGLLRRLTYVTAERVGPQEAYPLEDPHDAGPVGARGEHAVSALHWGRDDPVLPELTLAGAPATRLRQVEARMRTLFPGCGVDLQQVPQTNAVTLGLRTSDDTGFHRPIHTGFGLTQTLPIVVAALSEAPGDVMLIENPEVHLHPAGQALMGEFLADVARAGIQAVVETHSDHVLNGIRRAVRKAVGTFKLDRQRSFMAWLTRHGPFWEDARRHGGGDYLECFQYEGEVVTDTAVGEAAYCCLHGRDRGLVSMDPSDWLFSPAPVDWHPRRRRRSARRCPKLLECGPARGRTGEGAAAARLVVGP